MTSNVIGGIIGALLTLRYGVGILWWLLGFLAVTVAGWILWRAIDNGWFERRHE
jgi:hypothetical protein